MAVRSDTIFKQPLTQPDNTVDGQTDEAHQERLTLYRKLREEAKKIVEEGSRDATVQAVKEEEQNQEKFGELISEANKVLFRATSVFPFDFFPDEIAIDPVKVNIINKNFFMTGRTQSIDIKNIVDVYVDASILFATLKLVHVAYGENTVDIGYLKKRDAYQARKIILGLCLATKNGIDITKLPQKDLLDKLVNIGETKDVATP